MKVWPLIPRAQAQEDVERALDHYRQQADHIDVWRVLHGARDIPSWLEGGDGDG
jgi:plasmid stabilization system protein ParE